MSGNWIVSDISPESSPRSDCHLEHEEAQSARCKIFPRSNENSSRDEYDAKFKWLSNAWPIKPFALNLPMNERKSEWFRFRDQFDRIAACKPEVDQCTKLDGFKIHAGSYLLNVTEMQEKLIQKPCANIFTAVKEALNNYFNQLCDPSKERMKFREMRMGSNEIFNDWILRLENQAKFCEFSQDQREEEFLQAIQRRSVPEIGTKLYEVSNILGKNLEKIIAHGQHLDYMRRELQEKENKKDLSGEFVTDEASETKQVNFVRRHDRNWSRNSETGNYNHRRPNNRMSQEYLSRTRKECGKCGRLHGPRNCKAFGIRCHKCARMGHFAQYCNSAGSSSASSSRMKPKEEDSQKNIKNEVNMVQNKVLFSDSD